MDKQSGLEKIAALGISFAAGWVAQKVVEKVWDKSTGGLSHDLDDDEARVASIVTFAAVSAIVASLTQVLAKRSSKRMVSNWAAKALDK
ncbi:DUF4235 domain-containing protein [Timonella sp. A28]|uniref:DUF4235 domain-containing protein n=1 Tax=Timonella sp. A28 TaxID=3442640 RepID=UPI003EBED41A